MLETLLMPLAIVLISIIVVVWSADVFIDGAAATAAALGVSQLIIGITIVGFGTSAPEILISIFSALQGNPGLAIGNAIGSNIANIALILGITTLLIPIVVGNTIVRKEMPVLLVVMVALTALMWNNHLSLFNGVILLVLLGLVMTRAIYLDARKSSQPAENHQEADQDISLVSALAKLAVGLILLLMSARALVWGAVDIASTLGVSDLLIGLTIVAIGTSLPELAACIASARRRAYNIALGNIIGSNVFNSLAVVGISGIIHPTILPDGVMSRDIPISFGLTVLLIIMCLRFSGDSAQLGRIKGGLLLSCFIGYQILLFLQN